MRVLHVIPSLSLKHGGPSVALPLMARCVANQGVTVDVVTTDDDGPGGRMQMPLGQRVERDGYGAFYFPKQTEFYKVSLPLGRWLKQHVKDYDVIHIHALFSYASVAAARAAKRAGAPYIIRPLGVLNRWGMENRRRWLKALSFRWVEQPILRGAASIHYTSRAEQREAESAGVTAPAAVIPLGIDPAPFQNLPEPERFFERWPPARGKKIILFLSRLDPKKGVELLLEAWAKIQIRNAEILKAETLKTENPPSALRSPSSASSPSPILYPPTSDFLLVIAGSGEPTYERSLRELAVRLGIRDDVLWTGFLGGVDKLAAFAAASVFVLPSYSENFGIAVVEALAAGLPCITTDGVAVSEDIREHNAGLVVAEPATLAPALIQLLSDDLLAAKLGANAKKLAAEKFSLDAMGLALRNLYEEILVNQPIEKNE
jgi:glycosyltransferase involved in cell wall biosynthesis